MLYVLLTLGVVVLAAAGVAWWRSRREVASEAMSAVSRQHIDLYNGGVLDEAELETAKQRFNLWLLNDQPARVEMTLVPGLHYVVRLRALAELGTEEACAILEKQLKRQITQDAVEQSWYWIDAAHCLRMLVREESLPLMLDRVAQADDFPLVHFFAAEAVAFSSFRESLRDFPDRMGSAAVRTLHRAFEGLRCGISPQLVAEARLGEMIETVWDDHQHVVHPLLIRLFSEARRHLRRAGQFAEEIGDETFEREAYHLQISRLTAVDRSLQQYLDQARREVPQRLERASGQELTDWLPAVQDLRADAGTALVRVLRENPNLPMMEHAVLALGWSRTPQAAAYLRETAARALTQVPRRQVRWWQRRPTGSGPTEVAVAALLALRHHPSPETEQLLLAGARSADFDIRAAAIGSLGWWEPLRRNAVRMYLQDARFDNDADVRHAARAALARLGERQALQWFRQGMASDNRQVVMESIQAIADEGITLLWPELDQFADEEEPELASCAREALEQMQEELEREPKL
jgi:HEAT repeat protein